MLDFMAKTGVVYFLSEGGAAWQRDINECNDFNDLAEINPLLETHQYHVLTQDSNHLPKSSFKTYLLLHRSKGCFEGLDGISFYMYTSSDFPILRVACLAQNSDNPIVLKAQK